MNDLRTLRLLGTALVVSLLVGLSLAGCDSLLGVDNPNDLTREDLNNPASAGALANGAVATVSRAYSQMYGPYAAASDEFVFVGSRNSWAQIDIGDIRDPRNGAADQAFTFIAEARWMADEAIQRLKEFDANGRLMDRQNLVLAYHYGALIYLLIGDTLEDFALSDRKDAVPPIGEENMDQMYTTAIEYLDAGIAIAREMGNAEWEARILATRTRARHGLSVWKMLNPPGSKPNQPWVSNPDMVADAQAYLDLVGEEADVTYQFRFGQSTVANDLAGWLNERSEVAITEMYKTLTDPVTGVEDPRTNALISQITSGRFPPLTYVSSREVHLMLAEAALANGNTAEAVNQINIVRAMGGLEPYDPSASDISLEEMLRYERKANLFGMGRRLHDMYRFGLESPQWRENATAATTPGAVFPITVSEIDSNPHIN